MLTPLDKVVRTLSSYAPMTTRMRLVKRYNTYRRGDLMDARRDHHRSTAVEPARRMQDGYLIDKTRSLPYLDAVLADASQIISENRNPPFKKDYLINHLFDADLQAKPSFLQFATSPELVAIAADYLGFTPVLSTIELWKSNRGDVAEVGSQLFHLDNADDKQVKLFVNLIDIDEETGPFCFLPTTETRKVVSATRYGRKVGVDRLADDRVFGVVPEQSVVRCVGQAGDACFVDTVNCLHYGSRRNEKPRYVLMCQYLSPCRADFRPVSMRRFLQPGADTRLKFLLDPDFAG